MTGTSEEQQRVIAAPEKCLCVVAGAGSGKTKVLVERSLRINQSSTNQVLILTFSKAAAEELRIRLSKHENSERDKKINVFTFHALALRVLRTCEESFLKNHTGRSQGFSVLGYSEQLAVASLAVRELGKKGSPDGFLRSFLSRRHFKSSEALASGAEEKTKVDEFGDCYERRLLECNAFDIDYLVTAALKVLKAEPEVRETWQLMYSAILADEFQDSTEENLMLLLTILGPGMEVTVVGDDDQSIYGFRGAYPGILDSFRRRCPGPVNEMKLTHNFRSSGNIVKAAYSIILQAEGRIPKELWTSNPAGSKVQIALCSNVGRFKEHEALQLAKGVQTLHLEQNVPYSDIAVLARTRAIALDFRARLEDTGIPTMMMVKRKNVQFARPGSAVPAAVAAVALVRLVCNEKDFASFALLCDVFGVPKLFVSSVRVTDSVLKAAREQQLKLEDSKKEIFKLLLAIDRLKQYLKRRTSEANLRKTIFHALSLIPLVDGSSADTEALLSSARIADELCGILESEEDKVPENIPVDQKPDEDEEEDMFDLLKRNSTSKQSSMPVSQDVEKLYLKCLQKLQNRLDQMTQLEAENDGTSILPSKRRENVFCSTVHQAKGLEWKYVFLPRFNDGTIPLLSSVAEESDRHISEERRLTYVAFSRAKVSLFISHVLLDCNIHLTPSRFLADLPSEAIDKVTVEETPVVPGRRVFDKSGDYKKRKRKSGKPN